jgi:hypothetical protein
VSRRAFALVALLLLVVGCQSLPTATPLPPGDLRPQAYLRDLAARGAERRALRGVAKVALEGPGGASRSRQILVLERPARMRVEVQGFLNQLVAVLVSDGERFELFRAEDRSVEQGDVHPGILYQVAGIPLRPEAVVEVLLGAPDLGPRALPGPAALLSDGDVRVDLVEEGGVGLRRLRFDAEANLRQLDVLTDDGQLAWRVRFEDYRRVGELSFAHDVALDFPLAEARAEVSFQQVELNPELPPDVFGLRPVAAGDPG